MEVKEGVYIPISPAYISKKSEFKRGKLNNNMRESVLGTDLRSDLHPNWEFDSHTNIVHPKPMFLTSKNLGRIQEYYYIFLEVLYKY